MVADVDALQRAGVVSALDAHFTRLLARLDPAMTQAACLGAALASRAVREGHVCLDLGEIAGLALATGEPGTDLAAPALDEWLRGLHASAVVGEPDEFRPLVLDAAGRLYLYRYWDYERRLAHELRGRARWVPAVDRGLLAAQLQRLFPPADAAAPDWQRIAAAVAVLRGLCVISGGPGTGKTTTVTRVLAMLVEQADGIPMRIALAAPTGKAAMRMSEAVRAMKPTLKAEDGVRAAIPEQAGTLHRLLGYRPNGGGFRYCRDNPLPVDALVVDEASMIDQAMMVRIVEALAPTARLILLGDKDQLASVEAGAVLGDICAGWRGFSAPLVQELANVLAVPAQTLPVGGGQAGLGDNIVELRVSHRFSRDSGIGALAGSVNAGDVNAVKTVLGGNTPELDWLDSTGLVETRDRLAERAAALFEDYLSALASGAPPEQVFARFERVRILCALRGGPLGVDGVNRWLEEVLQRRGLIDARRDWYAGRPIMIARNDYNMGLFNGDVGLVLPDSAGRLRACFRDAEGAVRRLSPGRLPAHEPCYALTVHKSQGSEFDEVVVVMPQEDNRVLARELLYTAITRARRKVVLAGPLDVLLAAAARRTRRRSGLQERLWNEEAGPT
ncbi:MAG: exodeoxyribonuclease V subunit alpha [Gammaproteobacteria bacterium]